MRLKLLKSFILEKTAIIKSKEKKGTLEKIQKPNPSANIDGERNILHL